MDQRRLDALDDGDSARCVRLLSRLRHRRRSLSSGQVPIIEPIIGFTVPIDPTISQQSPNQGQRQAAFDFFSWQSFVALNWPADPQNRGFPNTAAPIGGPGPVVWETFNEQYEVFQAGPPRRPLPALRLTRLPLHQLRLAGAVPRSNLGGVQTTRSPLHVFAPQRESAAAYARGWQPSQTVAPVGAWP